MLPNNTNYYSNFSDPVFYSSLQQRVPPPHAQITFDYQPQLKELTPIEAASFAAASSTCQQRKRTSRADRHSKIRTAQGERDRRMRLSVQVAQQFFALQDKLGFDKASKTIDWLLTQAKDSIDQLSSIGSSSEPPSKEEIPTDQSAMSYHQPVHDATEILVQKQNKDQEGECQLIMKVKDLRAKARARARERAREKMKPASCQLDQLVPAADSLMDGTYNSMEYYYYLLNQILNGGSCGMDFEDEEGTPSTGAQFY